MAIHFTPAISATGKFRMSRLLGHHEIRVSADETVGTMGVREEAADPREGPPMHIQHREEELVFVLEGQFLFHCGDEVFGSGPGTTAVMPRGVPHAWLSIGIQS